MNNLYRITLKLSEEEYLALLRLGYKQCRSPRNQAHYLLREKLTRLHAITIYNPAPIQADTITAQASAT